jgi:hypothetical protein
VDQRFILFRFRRVPTAHPVLWLHNAPFFMPLWVPVVQPGGSRSRNRLKRAPILPQAERLTVRKGCSGAPLLAVGPQAQAGAWRADYFSLSQQPPSINLPGQIPLPSPRQSRMPTSSSFPTDRGFNFSSGITNSPEARWGLCGVTGSSAVPQTLPRHPKTPARSAALVIPNTTNTLDCAGQNRRWNYHPGPRICASKRAQPCVACPDLSDQFLNPSS